MLAPSIPSLSLSATTMLPTRRVTRRQASLMKAKVADLRQTQFLAGELEQAGVTLWRLTNRLENHRGYQFQDGWNVDVDRLLLPNVFEDPDICTEGIYFYSEEQLLSREVANNLNSAAGPMYWLREVTLGPLEVVIRVQKSKFKALKVHLGHRKRYDWTQHPHYLDLPLWVVPHDQQTTALLDQRFQPYEPHVTRPLAMRLDLRNANPTLLTLEHCKNVFDVLTTLFSYPHSFSDMCISPHLFSLVCRQRKHYLEMNTVWGTAKEEELGELENVIRRDLCIDYKGTNIPPGMYMLPPPEPCTSGVM